MATGLIPYDSPVAEHARYAHSDLHAFIVKVLEVHGLPPVDAAIAADALIAADLMGIDSHGIAHLPWHSGYVPGLRNGNVNPRPSVSTLRETPSTALLDADGGMGVVVAARAMELAIEKAAAVGVGMVAVANSRHFGAAGHWALMAVPHAMAGLATCNGSPIVAPAGGRDRVFNTNPIAFAAPAGDDHPFMFDAATSVVAAGKLELARYEGRPIPIGWAKDADYADTDDPDVLAKGGVLLPLGINQAGSWHKGHGLALIVEILSGIMSGNGHSALLARGGERYGHVGHFHAAIRIDAFRDLDDWNRDMKALYASVRGSRPAPGCDEVLVSGEKEDRIRRHRLKEGIPLPREVVAQLEQLAHQCATPFPPPIS
jgi:L-2-hydroxycarboxylate dehydrogenase (NAD+)